MAQPQQDKKTASEPIYEISTLGSFQVLYNGYDLTSTLSKSVKVWELFKYLLTFRDDLMLPEKIVESLWPEAEYVDPKRTLRALIFRLRQALTIEACPVRSHLQNSLIISSRGCYKFETNEYSNIDVVCFEELFRTAYDSAKNNPNKDIEQFQQVVSMYKGDYLSDTYGYDWLIPARNHYRRIFLQSVYEAAELLKEQRRYHEIISLCEAALKHELFEEDLHLFYMEALAGTGKLKQARQHFEYVKEVFARELGVEPSATLTQVYRMLFGEISKTGLNMNYIKDNLREETMPNGPMLCDKEFFKSLQHLESRRAERYGPTNFLGVLTLSLPDHTLPERTDLKEGMKSLKELLLSDLRKGDVITEWDEAQFLLSLPSLNAKQAEVALKRIQKKFVNYSSNPDLVLHYKVKDTLPD